MPLENPETNSAVLARPNAANRKARGVGNLLLVFLAIVIGIAVDALWIEPFHLEVTHHDVAAGVKSPIKIAHLTDFHTSGIRRREQRVFKILDEEKPDLIVVTGDSLGEWRGSYPKIHDVLVRLHAPLGVWVVRGNFENWRIPHNERAFYADAGVHFLLNAGSLARDDLWMAGIDDPSSGHPNIDAALTGAPADAYKILLFHAPNYFGQVAGRVNLCLTGHTHGGQVRVPFLPPLWMPKGCWPYVEGWYESGGTKMYVSRGIGMSLMPIRFDCRPEVAIFSLHP